MGVRDRKERSKGWMKGLAQCSWGGMMPLAVPNSFGMLHNDTQNALTANAADYITLQ